MAYDIMLKVTMDVTPMTFYFNDGFIVKTWEKNLDQSLNYILHRSSTKQVTWYENEVYLGKQTMP